MKTRILIGIAATALGVFAQEAKTIVMAQTGVMGGVISSSPAQPGVFKFFTESVILSGSPVIGAPYSAEEKTESVQTLGDGTHITNTTTTRTYRDSQGRTRREMTLQTGAPGMPGRTTISISDPAAGISYSLDPEAKVAHQMSMPKFAGLADAKLKAEAATLATKTGTQTQTQSYGLTSNGQNLQYKLARREGMMAAPPPEMKHEDLGDDTIEGVRVHGMRDTSTIPQGAVGNDRPITTVSERWYSSDLKVEVKSVYSDPRMGQTTHTLTGINRSEPDSSLFAPPPDYTIDAQKAETREFHQ